MKRTYQITGVVLLLFSAFIGKEALELKFYTSLGPGPGFFPFWLSVVFGVLAAMMLFSATFTPSPPMPADFFPSRKGALKGLAVVGALVFVTAAMQGLGFRLSMVIFYVFLLVTLGRVNLIATVLVTLAGSWGMFWLFNEKLQVPLPAGALDEVWDGLGRLLLAPLSLFGS